MNEIFMVEQCFFANVDPRKKQALYESRLIQEDHRAPSNLPRHPINRVYNNHKYTERLDMYNQSQEFGG